MLRLRWPLLALTLVLTAIAVWLVGTRLETNNTTEYFARGNPVVRETLEDFRADFGRDDLYFVLIEGDVFDPVFLERLKKLHEALERFDVELPSQSETEPKKPEVATVAEPDEWGEFGDAAGWGEEAGGTIVDEVLSLVNAREMESSGGGIRVHGLLDELPSADEIPALKARVLANESLVGTLVGPNATHTAIAIRTPLMSESDSGIVVGALGEFVAPYDVPGFHVTLTGLPILNKELNGISTEDMRRLVLAAMVVMACVLGFLFRSPVGVIPPLAVIALSSLWALGGMAATGTPMTLMTNIIPAFLATVGLGDSVHLLSVYRDLRGTGMRGRDAIVKALATTGTPMVFTSVTTAAGLASFYFASTQAVQEMGIWGAWGVMFALLHTFVFLPIVLSIFGRDLVRKGVAPKDTGERHRDFLDTFIDACTDLSARKRGRRLVMGGSALLSIVCLFGMARLDVYHNPLVWFGPDSPVTVGITTMDREVGGSASASVVIDAEGPLGVRDLELLRGLDQLEKHILAYRHPKTGEPVVTNVISLVDVAKEANRALHGTYALPSDQRAATDALLMFENSSPGDLMRLATGDLKRTHLTVRLKWMDASSYQPFRHHLEDGIARYLKQDGVTVRPTGTVYTILSVVDGLISDLLKSFGTALVAITVLMILLVRDLKLGLVSMLPNLLPIAFVMGFMGFAGIDIDMVNLLIASVIIGIAVDDTIHYLYQYQRGRNVLGTTEKGIHQAIDHAGRAMVSTSLVLVLGFSVYLASRLASIQRFGILCAIACIVALLADLLLTPALVRAVYADPER